MGYSKIIQLGGWVGSALPISIWGAGVCVLPSSADQCGFSLILLAFGVITKYIIKYSVKFMCDSHEPHK